MADTASPAGTHVFPLRVYFEDTDAGGIVYYANYLRFAERARTEMLRAFGADHARMMKDDGVMFAVRHCVCDFVAPARLDDAIEVHTSILEVGGASLRLSQVVRRGAAELVRLVVRLACLTTAGRPARLPDSVRTILNSQSLQEQKA